MKKYIVLKILFIFLLQISILNVFAKFERPEATKIISYKKAKDSKGEDVDLKLHIFNPEGHKKEDKKPVMVFFHGGGWNGGTPKHFYKQSAYLAKRGIVAISVEYRIKKEHGTTPIECIKDCKSAMRWVKKNANELGIDSDKILAGGGSAGGHLAVSVALLPDFNEEAEDTSFSCVPKALALFNPVVDCGPGSKPYSRIKQLWKGDEEMWKKLSPLHNISKDAPPTIVFQGKADEIVDYKSIEKFEAKMKEMGVRCEAHYYEGEPHSFFNKNKYYETVLEMDKFLISLGYLQGEPTIKKN